MVRTIFLQCQGKIRAVYFELGKVKILKKVRKNCNRNTTDLLALKAGKAIGSLISVTFFLNEAATRLSFLR